MAAPDVLDNTHVQALAGQTASDLADRLRSLVISVLNDHTKGQMIRERDDACVGRIMLSDVDSVIFKCWRRHGVRSIAHTLLHIGSMQREWDALERLHVSGIRAPAPVAHFIFDPAVHGYTHCVMQKDLGDLQQSTDYIKQCMDEHNDDALHAFDTDLIDLTQGMLAEHVVDPDHRLINILVSDAGRPFRIDLELARIYRLPSMHIRAMGLMLGRLIGSYAFAVQPDEQRFVRFADRLLGTVNPPRLSLAVIRRTVCSMLKRQVRDMGITFQPDLSLT